jgi:hypothetical protein
LEVNVFLFGPFHVLALYAWNRLAGIIEYDEGVYEEIQRRAALVPPAQRQAAIDAMVKDRVAIGMEVFLRRKKEQDRIMRRNRWIALAFWLIVAYVFYLVYWR